MMGPMVRWSNGRSSGAIVGPMVYRTVGPIVRPMDQWLFHGRSNGPMVQYFRGACERLGRLGVGLGNALGRLGVRREACSIHAWPPWGAWEACGDLGSLGECLGMLRGSLVRLGEAWGMLGMYIQMYIHNASGRLGEAAWGRRLGECFGEAWGDLGMYIGLFYTNSASLGKLGRLGDAGGA